MLKTITVKSRLFLLILLMSILAIALSIFGLYGMKKSNEGLKTVYIDRTIPIAELSEIKYAALHIRTALVTDFLFPEEKLEQQKNIITDIKKIENIWNEYIITYLTPEEKILADNFIKLKETFFYDIKKVVDLQNSNESDEAKRYYFETARASYQMLSENIISLVELQKKVAKEEYNTSQNRYSSIIIYSIILLILGLFISLFTCITIIKNLMKELGGEPHYTAKVVKEIANGNLSVKIDLQHGDSSSLLFSIDKMREMLFCIIENTNLVMKETAIGNLSSRINIDTIGDFSHLKIAVNNSLDTIQSTLSDVVIIADALANGELNKKITKNYSGVFGETALAINNTVNELVKLVEEIDNIVYSGADCGDFSVKMSINGKKGYSKRLAELINQLFSTTERSLNDVLFVSESLADGDLTKNITNDYPGTFAEVKAGINTTVESLRNLIGEIKNTSEIIAEASKEISLGNNDLSHRTEEQAASLEQTAASMEELTTIVKQNTDNAKNANVLAMGASKAAKIGVDVVDNVVKTMSNINESSHKIVDIVSVIDDIAFQTNILALNAAVEAARAGDQGLGFAVVAVEVRNLAQRAANAAAEVKQLISDSVDRINSGSDQVMQAGKTMEDIVFAIQEVTNIMSNIEKSSQEQNEGILQIYQAVTQMDGVTQQNAALVDEAAMAADSLSQQTGRLAIEMAHFKTEINQEYTWNINPQNARFLQEKQEAIIIDVRENNEWNAGHINGAIHIPLNEIEERISELMRYKNNQLILQCRSGGRSMKAIDILKKSGFNNLKNMDGGLNEWIKVGLPIIT